MFLDQFLIVKNVVKCNSSWCRSREPTNLPPYDLSLSLGTEMVEISKGLRLRFSLWTCERQWNKQKSKNMMPLPLKRYIYRFPMGLSNLNPLWVWVT